MVSDKEKLEPTASGKPSGNRRRERARRNGKKGGRKGQGNRGNNSAKDSLLPSRTKRAFHSNLPPLPVRKVKEPLETCPLCDKVIENIAESFSAEDGRHCHFDCVLRKIAQDEQLTGNQKISYIGRGTFAVVEPKEGGGFTFVKRIVWENQETFDAMKKYVEASKK
jgi:hypothetical protein